MRVVVLCAEPDGLERGGRGQGGEAEGSPSMGATAELYTRLRQLDWKSATFGSDDLIKVDDLVIDVSGYEAKIRGRKIDLTHQEFELLRFLAQNRGKVFTREQLLQKVWGYRYYG